MDKVPSLNQAGGFEIKPLCMRTASKQTQPLELFCSFKGPEQNKGKRLEAFKAPYPSPLSQTRVSPSPFAVCRLSRSVAACRFLFTFVPNVSRLCL